MKNITILLLFVLIPLIGFSQKDFYKMECYTCNNKTVVNCNGCDISTTQFTGLVMKGMNGQDIALHTPVKVQTRGYNVTLTDAFGTQFRESINNIVGVTSMTDFLSQVAACTCGGPPVTVEGPNVVYNEETNTYVVTPTEDTNTTNTSLDIVANADSTVYTISVTDSDGGVVDSDLALPTPQNTDVDTVDIVGGYDLVIDGVPYKIPDCPSTFVSELGEAFVDSTCSQKTYDITGNDIICDGGIYVVENIMINGLSNSLTPLAYATLSGGGTISYVPLDCSAAITIEITSHIKCPDGSISNSAIDVITYIPPPVGEVRISKNNNTDDNQVEEGEVFSYQISVSNVGTGDVIDPVVRDLLPACLQYVGTNATVTPTVSGQEIEFDFTGTTIPANTGGGIVFNIDVEVVCNDFVIQTNLINVTADDGAGGVTSDNDVDNVEELSFCVPEASLRPFANNFGRIHFDLDIIQQPVGAAPCGTEIQIPIYRDGVLWETLTGDYCDAINTTNFSTDRTDNLSVLNYGIQGDATFISWNNNTWNTAISNDLNGGTCDYCCTRAQSAYTAPSNGSLTQLSPTQWEWSHDWGAGNPSAVWDIYRLEGSAPFTGNGFSTTVLGGTTRWVLRELTIPETGVCEKWEGFIRFADGGLSSHWWSADADLPNYVPNGNLVNGNELYGISGNMAEIWWRQITSTSIPDIDVSWNRDPNNQNTEIDNVVVGAFFRQRFTTCMAPIGVEIICDGVTSERAEYDGVCP